jgi:hypothetical protein
MLISYPEPAHRDTPIPSAEPSYESAPGVWALANGQYSHIQPAKTIRQTRRQACCHHVESSELLGQ